MARFTNISNGPRGIHTADGIVFAEAGETIDVTPAKDEDPNEEWFAKAGSAAAKAADADPLDHDGDGRKGGARKPVAE